jgi:hypothetical protein
MSENSKIEWTDHTFNPWIGRTKVRPACDHCYAERSTPSHTLGVEWGTHAESRRTSAPNWALPKRWNAQADAFRAQHGRRQRVFCASLADVFDNQVPANWRADLFELIHATPNLDWLLLTKRRQRRAHGRRRATGHCPQGRVEGLGPGMGRPSGGRAAWHHRLQPGGGRPRHPEAGRYGLPELSECRAHARPDHEVAAEEIANPALQSGRSSGPAMCSPPTAYRSVMSTYVYRFVGLETLAGMALLGDSQFVCNGI